MAQNIIENIFSTKQTLNNLYPSDPGTKTFDLHTKHNLYGRIDKDGDAIILDDSKLNGGQRRFCFERESFSNKHQSLQVLDGR